MADTLRALTINVDSAEDAELPVELCPEGRVYSLNIQATAGATLELQDSRLVIDAAQTEILRFVFPGLRFPAFARFLVPAGSVAHLHIMYGNCAL